MSKVFAFNVAQEAEPVECYQNGSYDSNRQLWVGSDNVWAFRGTARPIEIKTFTDSGALVVDDIIPRFD